MSELCGRCTWCGERTRDGHDWQECAESLVRQREIALDRAEAAERSNVILRGRLIQEGLDLHQEANLGVSWQKCAEAAEARVRELEQERASYLDELMVALDMDGDQSVDDIIRAVGGLKGERDRLKIENENMAIATAWGDGLGTVHQQQFEAWVGDTWPANNPFLGFETWHISVIRRGRELLEGGKG